MRTSTARQTLAATVLALAGGVVLSGCSAGADGDYYGSFVGPNVIRHVNIDGDKVTFDLATCDEEAGELVHYDGLDDHAEGTLVGEEADRVVQWIDSTEEEWEGKSPVVLSEDAVTMTAYQGRGDAYTFGTEGAGGSAEYVAECS